MMPGSNKKQRGFTLIEVLVVFTLLAMMMGLIFSGLNSSRSVVEKGEKRITAINEIRVVQQMIRHQLSRMLSFAFAENDDGLGVVFLGDAQSVTYVSQMPGYLGSGGPHLQRIELASDGKGKFLQFKHTLMSDYTDEATEPDFDAHDPVVLLENIRSARFSFIGLDEEGEATDWMDAWEDTARLPLMVGLEIEMGEGAREHWPTLHVAMMLDGASVRSGGRGSLHSRLQNGDLRDLQ